MKIRGKYLLREIAGENIAVPLSETTADANMIIALNETGAVIWEKLYEGIDLNLLVSFMTEEYDVDEETAKQDIASFLCYLKDNNVALE